MGAHLRIGLLLTAIVCTASIVSADEKAKPKESTKEKEAAKETEQDVPFPKLPEKAGKISEKASKKFTQTKSGLKYRLLRESKGISPVESDAVEIWYQMWLDDGTVVWSCYDDGNTQTFKVNRSLKGLKEGLQLLNKGGMIELEIPAKLAWDNTPPEENNNIPANSTIHVVIELVAIKGLDYVK